MKLARYSLLAVLLWVAGANVLATLGSGGLLLSMPQQASPLLILSATSTADRPYSTVRVRNTSDRQIARVEFGIAVHEASDLEGLRQLVPTTAALRIDPSQEASVSLDFGVTTSELARRVDNRGVAEVGVRSVAFAAGEPWSSRIDTRRRFSDAPLHYAPSGVACSGAPGTVSSVLAMMFRGGFYCDGTTDYTNCTGGGPQCTDSFCGLGDDLGDGHDSPGNSGWCTHTVCAVVPAGEQPASSATGVSPTKPAKPR